MKAKNVLPDLGFKESTIRYMTRLSVEKKAINLGQGYPLESPPFEMRFRAVCAIISGNRQSASNMATHQLTAQDKNLRGCLASFSSSPDTYNQYAVPYGVSETRQAIARYYNNIYTVDLDYKNEITICVGATEAIGSALRAVTLPGDIVVMLEPFHEMYPNQAAAFYCKCRYVPLEPKGNKWVLDYGVLETALDGAKVLILNTPHNPTGTVFTITELEKITSLCKKHNVYIITDEIYEHIIYDKQPKHEFLYGREELRDTVICVNSISKTASATGWRIGWTIANAELTTRIRAVHDTIAMQAATPLQHGAISLLEMDVGDLLVLTSCYEEKRDYLSGKLRDLKFGVGPLPQGAYYLFVQYSDVNIIGNMTPREAAEYLVCEIGVATIPGCAFYSFTTGTETRYLRFAFCKPMDTLREAVGRLSKLNL